LFRPYGLALDSAGNLLIADTLNNRIRRVDAITHLIITVAGNGQAAFGGDGGPAILASLNNPTRVTLDTGGNLFIADGKSPFANSGNQRIRRVDAITNIITTYAGNGTEAFAGDGGLATSANLASPTSVAFARDRSGRLFVVDSGSQRIRVVTPGP
jgi:sugar lactone lactonase YvrE